MFGIPGQGFYSIHLPTEKSEQKKEVLGIMVIEYGLASTEIIEKELTTLFKDVHKWTIKKMTADNEYMVTFPSVEIRE